jgi:hypothetical protein
MCEQNCVNADGSRAPDGLYGNATGFSFGTNRVSATNTTGETVFGVNEPFHVPDINAEPQRLIAPPAFLADRLTGRERNVGKGTGTQGTQEAAGAGADGRSASSPTPPEALPTTAPEQRDSSGQLAALTTAASAPGASPIPGTGNVGAIYFDDGVPDRRQLTGASLTVDAQGQLTAFSDGSTTGMRGSGNALDVGSNAAAGNLHWGMWPDATVNGMPVTHLHFIVGDVASLPGTGIFTYSPVGVGGTRPTNAAGLAGMFLAGTVTVNFGIKDLQLNGWQIGFNGATFTQSGAANTSFSSPTFTGGISYNCSGSCGGNTSPVAGSYAGSFAGSGAPGMGVVYNVQDPNNGEIIGAQGFKR